MIEMNHRLFIFALLVRRTVSKRHPVPGVKSKNRVDYSYNSW